MKYPMLNNWLIFKRKSKTTYNVRDCLYDEEFTMGIAIANFARKLNGKRNPYTIDNSLTHKQVQEILNALEEYNLLRHSMVLTSSPGTVYRTLWIPKNRPLLRVLAVVCNTLLKTLWLPVFIIGLFLFAKYLPLHNFDYILIGTALGLVTGLLLHELGHASAGLAYGARVFEIGIMITNFLPGAYVMLETEHVKSKQKRIQINMAGVEANMLLAGILFIMACIFVDIGVACLCAAINNIIIALVNITFAKGLDGADTIAELLGIDDLIGTAKTVISSRRTRRNLRRQGATGHAIIVISVMLQTLQITLPLLIGLNILEVIEYFLGGN